VAEARIRITADTNQAQAALGNVNKALGNIQTTSNMVSRALGGLVAALSIRAIANFSDEITSVRNRLNQLSDTQEGVNAQFKALAGIALEARTPLSQTADLYFRIARNADALGISQREAAEITRSVAKAISASGMSAAEAAGPLLQLGQALQSGRFQGDELRSILEGLPPVARALANSLGVPIGALKELGAQGRIQASDFVKAMREAKDSIEKDFLRTVPTIAQAGQQLKTALGLAYDEFEQNTKTGQSFARMIQIAAGAILILADEIDNIMPYLTTFGKIVIALAGASMIGKLTATIIGLAGAVRIAMMTFGGWLGLLLKIGAAIGAYVGMEMFADSLDATGDGASFADKALRKLSEAQTKYLDGLNDTAKAAPAAYDGKLIENQRKALEDRNKALKEALADGEQAIKIAGLEGLELETANRLYSINKSLIKEIKNEKGEIVGYTQGLNAEEAKNVALQIEQAHYIGVRKALNTELNAAIAEANRLSITDLDLREQQAAVDAKRLQLARELTAEEDALVRATVARNQANREGLALEQQKALLAGQASRQTREQQIQTATGAISRLDPRLSAEQQYQTEKAALAAMEYENEKQKYDALSALDREYAQKKSQMTVAMFEEQLKASGVVNAEILNVSKTTMAQAMMVTQGGIVGIQGALGMLGGFLEQAGKNNKKAFEAQKAVAIAQTVISTYQAATQAFAAMSVIPIIGPALGFAAAATIVAAGLANVAQIRSQQYQGRQLGGPVMGGTPYIVGENGPELFTPNTTGSITRNSDLGGGGEVNINFSIVANDTTGFDELLSSRQGMIKQIISDAMLERGQRSVV
jgi:tape measure domain-containing protein